MGEGRHTSNFNNKLLILFANFVNQCLPMTFKTLLLGLVLFGSTITCFTQPKISGFSPSSGPIGTSVTITGSGFSTIASENIVYFGATRATVKTATVSLLTLTVPAGATYQPITVLTNGLMAYSTKPFVVTFDGPPGFDSNSFVHNDFLAGSTDEVLIGDLDGDGKADLVGGYLLGSKIFVLRNNSVLGSIDFASKTEIGSFGIVTSVSIGDLDADGRLDIVVVDSAYDGRVSVLRNISSTGSIVFAPKVDFVTGKNPNEISIGDIDVDGKADLIVLNSIGNTVSVLRNTSVSGSISFASKANFPSGKHPNSIAVGDLDGDGKVDLALTNFDSNTISILRNTSSPNLVSFDSKIDLDTNPYPRSISIGDLDGDGKADLAFADSNFILSLFRNNSSTGAISFEKKQEFKIGSPSPTVSIGDLDGDGKVDLTGRDDDFALYVLKNTSAVGLINFDLSKFYSYGSVFNPGSVSIGDLDGDGKADLVEGSAEDGSVAALRNTIKRNQAIIFGTLQSKVLGEVPFTLSATASSGLSVVYSATPSDKVIINGDQITLVKPGNVTITATQAGDSNFAAATPVNRSFCINPLKPIITITEVASSPSKLTSSSSIGNQWFLNGNPIPGATSSIYFASQSGRYQVKVTTEDGCSSELSAETIFVITGVSNNNLSTQLYPNPVNKSVTILFEDHNQIKEVSIYQSTGKLLECIQVSEKEIELNLEHYPEGVYIARVVSGGNTKVIRFLKLCDQ